MAKKLSDTAVLNRRIKRSLREITATILLTLAACGFLIAAVYGGGIASPGAEDVFDPVSAWNEDNALNMSAEKPANEKTARFHSN